MALDDLNDCPGRVRWGEDKNRCLYAGHICTETNHKKCMIFNQGKNERRVTYEDNKFE